VSVGEFVAFTIGWNLILEYVIGTSSVARGLSGYIDTLLPDGYQMGTFWRSILPMNIDFLADYPDLFAFVIVMILAVLLATGVKESTFLNNIFTCVNLVTIVIVLVAGSLKAKTSNWAIDKEDIPEGDNINGGEGGFMPFGIAGVMAGAAKCFYGFVGFDCVATTGEEAKNPKRNIPLAIVISLIIIFFAYFGISTVLTMMLPYYLQDKDAPIPVAFKLNDMNVIANIVSFGAIFALSTSLLGAMFPLPRVLYAMGNDGIIYKVFKKVNPRTQTPLIATILSGLLAAFMATIFDLEQLIDMMSIGTLLAYTIVAICVLILHYASPRPISNNFKSVNSSEIIRQITNFKFTQEPSRLSSDIVKVCVSVFCVLCIALCTLLEFSMTAPIIIGLIIVSLAILLTILIISRQPRDEETELSFKVPLVPILPCISILMNLYLMFQLDTNTWIRFGVWLAIGKLYFSFFINYLFNKFSVCDIQLKEN
jgi:solute carrier family 7 (cationic amino acid transporter), member 3